MRAWVSMNEVYDHVFLAIMTLNEYKSPFELYSRSNLVTPLYCFSSSGVMLQRCIRDDLLWLQQQSTSDADTREQKMTSMLVFSYRE